MSVVGGIEQLDGDANAVRRFLHAAFEDVRYSEPLRDLRQIIGRAFVTLG